MKDSNNGNKNEMWSQVVFEKSPLPMLIIELEDLRFLAANPAAEKLFGYTNEELLKLHFNDIVPTEDYDKVEQAIRKVKPDNDIRYTLRNINRNHEIIDVYIVATLIKFNNVTAILKIATDVTEMNKAQAVIESQKYHFDVLFNASPFAIALCDADDKVIKINVGFEKLFLFKEEEIRGKKLDIIVPGERLEEYKRIYQKLQQRKKVQMETVRQTKDKKPIDVLLVSYPLLISNEILLGYYGMYINISGQKTAERKLYENEQITSKIIDTALDAVIQMNDKGKVTGWNKQAEHIFGYSQKEALGAFMSNLIVPPVYRESHRKGLKHFLKTGEQKLLNKRIEITAMHKNGTEFPVELAISPILISGKYSFSAFLRDISEQKLWQQQLMDNNYELKKINAELDRFVYSISHDLRAPLTNIMGLFNIMEDVKEQAQQKILINKGSNAVKRLDEFIKIILEYSRNSRLEIKPSLINFEELIAESWENYSYMKGAEKISLDVKSNQIIPFTSDRGRISIILNNLISNAIIYSDPAEKEPCTTVEIEVDKDFAHIVFRDNGIGIEKKYQKKVFEMFFRASQESTGSGLGLYIVKEVVKKLGGNIKMKSELQKGTAIIIDLPNQKLC
ncbi:MAG: PAS domain-containing sensor histidine kinase [Bacteroidota bacterium]|nr:PAS domain-containing sensor histidine kinase [Bacteroidota bacterium]